MSIDLSNQWKGNTYGKTPSSEYIDAGTWYCITNKTYEKITSSQKGDIAIEGVNSYKNDKWTMGGVPFSHINLWDAYPMPFIRRLSDVVRSLVYYVNLDYSEGCKGIQIYDGGKNRGFRPPSEKVNSYDSSGGFNDNHKWGGAIDCYFLDNNNDKINANFIVKIADKHKVPCTCMEGFGAANKTVHIAGGYPSKTYSEGSWCFFGSEQSKATWAHNFGTYCNYSFSNNIGIVPISGEKPVSIGNGANGVVVNWDTSKPLALKNVTTVNDSVRLDYQTISQLNYNIKDGFALSTTYSEKDEIYYFRVQATNEKKLNGFILNSTGAESSQTIHELQPYVFKYTYRDPRKVICGTIKDWEKVGSGNDIKAGYKTFVEADGTKRNVYTDANWFDEDACYIHNANGRIYKYVVQRDDKDNVIYRSLVLSSNRLPVVGLYIYDKNPMTNSDLAPKYILERSLVRATNEKGEIGNRVQSLLPDTYYIIKTDCTIHKPYIGIKVRVPAAGDRKGNDNDLLVDFKDFEFHKVNGKIDEDEYDNMSTFTADENDVFLMKNLRNGEYFSNAVPWKINSETNKKIWSNNYTGIRIDKDGNETNDVDKVVNMLGLMVHTDDSISAYTKSKTRYFFRNNYRTIYDASTDSFVETCINKNAEDEITYLDISNDVIEGAKTSGTETSLTPSKIEKERSIALFDDSEKQFKYYFDSSGQEDEAPRVEKTYTIYEYAHSVKNILSDCKIVLETIADRAAEYETVGKELSDEEKRIQDDFLSIQEEFSNQSTAERTIEEVVQIMIDDENILASPESTYAYTWLSDLTITSVNPSATAADLPEDDSLSPGSIFHLPKPDKYYQYYQIDASDSKGSIGHGGGWNYAFFGNGNNDKRRTLTASKSNRFNLIQQLAELFKCWPVFDISRNADGSLLKRIWFRESCLRENFAGFHKGVNVSSISRQEKSDSIVTKMYVENVENSISNDGYITITKAKHNPSGENFLYNFRYFIEQHLLDTKDKDGNFLIDNEVNSLYTALGLLNTRLLAINELAINLKLELNNYSAVIKNLEYSIAAKNQQIVEYEAYLNGEVQSLTTNKQMNYEEKLQKTIIERDNQQQELDIQKNNQKLDQEEYDGYLYEIEVLQASKNKRIAEFEQKYINYIKEGVWSDSSYADNDTYYLDAQKAGNTSAIPTASWSIQVANGECLEQLKDFHFKVGDKTFLIDKDFFNKKNSDKEYQFEVLISGLKDYLDNPSKNEIEVRNYSTSFDDLFHRISAATQTIQLKEQVFDRGANFTATGQIQSDVIQDTLSSNPLTLTKNANDTYTLDETGLELHSIMNPTNKIKITSDGIFLSNSRTSTGDVDWKTAINANGLNADVVSAGEIDAGNVRITNSGQTGLEMDNLGFTAYDIDGTDAGEDENEAYGFTRMDKFGIYHMKKNYGAPFKTTKIKGVSHPWFDSLKSRSDAIDLIEKNADFSVTENGVMVNVGMDDVSEITYAPISGPSVIKYYQNGQKTNPTTITVYSATDTDLKSNVFYKDSNGEYLDNFVYSKLPNIDLNNTNNNAYKNNKYVYPLNMQNKFVKLGYSPYEEHASKNEQPFGLYVQSNNQCVVQLQNNGENKIGGWQINPDGLYRTSNGYPIGAGMFSSEDNNGIVFFGGATGTTITTTSLPFYVTNSGTVYASKLVQGGDEVATKTDVSTDLEGYVKSSVLTAYETKADLTTKLNDYLKVADYDIKDEVGDWKGKTIKYGTNDLVVQNTSISINSVRMIKAKKDATETPFLAIDSTEGSFYMPLFKL